jgi:hypothetical protein
MYMGCKRRMTPVMIPYISITRKAPAGYMARMKALNVGDVPPVEVDCEADYK